MLENLEKAAREFETVKEKYEAVRSVLEGKLLDSEAYLKDSSGISVKIETEHDRFPIEIQLSSVWYEWMNTESREEQLQSLKKFRIKVSLKETISGAHSDISVPPTNSLVPKYGDEKSDSTSITQAKNVIENLQSLVALFNKTDR